VAYLSPSRQHSPHGSRANSLLYEISADPERRWALTALAQVFEPHTKRLQLMLWSELGLTLPSSWNLSEAVG
jgi:hypothetical protein